MLEHIVFHTIEAERACRVEAKRLQIARHHLHRSNAAGFHRRHETLAAWKRILGSGAPETEPGRIGKVLYAGGARRRDIEDPGTRRRKLQAQPGETLLGGFDPPARF